LKFEMRQAEARFGKLARPPADIAFSDARNPGFHREVGAHRRAVRQQEIFFSNDAFRELRRERAVGRGGFAEDNHAAGFLVEAMQDGQV
jgi:hypothetical protein